MTSIRRGGILRGVPLHRIDELSTVFAVGGDLDTINDES